MIETVVVTASADAFPGLTAALKKLPVTVEQRPLISFVAPSDWGPLDAALERLGHYAAVAFTSPRAAEPFAARLRELRSEWQAGDAAPVIWASGPQTAAALGGAVGRVRVPLGRQQRLGAALALARAILDEPTTGPVLFPCGESHREELPAVLRENGIAVDEVICYRSVLAPEPEARVAASRASVLVVASPRVAGLLARVCARGARPQLLAVGPTTAESARAAGWPPAAIASEPTARGLAAAVRTLLASAER